MTLLSIATRYYQDMKSRLPKPTMAEAHRMDWIKRDGCIPCRKKSLFRIADAHHLLSGGYRISHGATIPLCKWHHEGRVTDAMGLPATDWTASQMKELLGPNYKDEKKAFTDEFGTEQSLLDETNDRYRQAGYNA